MMYNSAASVLEAIAHECGCHVNDIEYKLESLSERAGIRREPMYRAFGDEETRLDVIRQWLRTPEARGIVEQTRDYIRRMKPT